MSSQRPIRLPPLHFPELKLPAATFPAATLWRVHDQGKPAVHFSLNPGHRFSHPAAAYPVLYLGEDLETCLWERFGDDIYGSDSLISRNLWLSRAVSRVAAPALRICDLTDAATRAAAKVDVSALTHTDLAVPQAWGLALESHPAGFDGLRYASRFNGRPCWALFGRNGLARRLKETFVCDLGRAPEGDAFLRENAVALV